MREFHLRWVFVFLLTAAVTAAQQPGGGGLRIVVVDGEDGVNIIQNKTAVQPVVEVRDRNDLPVAGVAVTFVIVGSKTAIFGGSAQQVTLATDSVGRAAVNNLQVIGKGSFRIQVNASYQGQTATASINQTNFATVADAAKAGKTPGSQNSQSGSQSANSGSQATNAGTSAGSSAGSSAGAAAGSSGGVGGGLSGAAIGGIAAGGAVATVVVAKKVIDNGTGGDSGPQCTSQLNALNAQETSINNALNTYTTCLNGARTQAQVDACLNSVNSAFSNYFIAAGNLCTCLGSDFSTGLSAADKAAVRDAFNSLRSLGINVGTLPACYQ